MAHTSAHWRNKAAEIRRPNLRDCRRSFQYNWVIKSHMGSFACGLCSSEETSQSR